MVKIAISKFILVISITLILLAVDGILGTLMAHCDTIPYSEYSGCSKECEDNYHLIFADDRPGDINFSYSSGKETCTDSFLFKNSDFKDIFSSKVWQPPKYS